MKSRYGLAYCLIKLSIQAEFAAGTFLHASEAAFITKSLTDNFIPSLLSISFSSDLNLQIEKMETASYIMVVSGLNAMDKTPTYEIPLTLFFVLGFWTKAFYHHGIRIHGYIHMSALRYGV